MKPLTGIRVLDLTRILAGPWTTQTLADLGAEVIKIERPPVGGKGGGDDTRGWGPPFAQRTDDDPHRQAAYYLGANRGKKSVAVDLKDPKGREVVHQLALKSDVLIENFKAGDLKRYGLDYETLSAQNPGLVFCSITGFGQTGPRASQAGYDLMIQGMAGLMSITGEADGQPMKAGVALVDVLTGLNAGIAIIAALYQRQSTGKGTVIDLALYDVMAQSLANQAQNYLVSGKAPGRMGNKHPNIAPYQAFAVADGYVLLAIGNDNQFANFCLVAGLPELPGDTRFATNTSRVAHRDILIPMVEAALLTKPRDHWLAALKAVGVPCGPINDISEVFTDPQAVARGLVQEVPHLTLGTVKTVASPIRYDGQSITSETAPPMLGQHTEEVLREVLGESVDGLLNEGIGYQSKPS